MDTDLETCRSCLEEKDVRYQFPLTTTYRDRTIIELIQDVTNIKVYQKKNLPQRICNSCLEKFSIASKIKQQFIKSDSSLRNKEATPKVEENDDPELPMVKTEMRPKRSSANPLYSEYMKKMKDDSGDTEPKRKLLPAQRVQDPICYYCHQRLPSKLQLFTHMDQHRESNDGKFHCPNDNKCFYETETSNVMFYHIASH